MAEKKQIKDVKLGEYVRLTENGPVWVRGEYYHESRSYSLTKFEDTCKEIFRGRLCEVFVGFTF